jgi:anaerobic selenocysteine-containing dehydrogenase
MKVAAATGATAVLFAGFEAQGFAEGEGASIDSDIQRVRTCCRGCGKMECGVWVTVENGRAIKVEGDTSAFQSGGNCCTKSQASIQAAYHPARLYYPMKRTNSKDAVDPGWVRITWDEALQTAGDKYTELIEKYGTNTLIAMAGTSRVWCMQSYGAFRPLFQSANNILPWQVCKGPRHFATAMQSAFAYSWQATVDKPRVMVRWGAATELSNYDDSCRTTVDAANDADIYIIVDPRLTNSGKEATIWQNLYPQTDGALALSWCDVVIKNDLIDTLFVKKWTNAPMLVCNDIEPDGSKYPKFCTSLGRCSDGFYDLKTRLLKESDVVEEGSTSRFMVWDQINEQLTYYDAAIAAWEGQTYSKPEKGREAAQKNLYPGVAQGWVLDPTGFGTEDGFATPIDPALQGEFEITLKDGKRSKVRPVWEYFVERCAEYSPDKAEAITGIPAAQIEKAALAYATRLDPASGYGNGGIGYMLAVEHGCNSIQNCRILDALVGITGNWDTPGGHRGSTFTPMKGYQFAQENMGGLPPISDELYLKQAGAEEFPVLQWWQYWADADSMYRQIESRDPYPIVGGICESGDFMNMGNTSYNWKQFTGLDFFVVADLWHTPLSGKADILMPVQHWIEIDCPRPSQGSGGAMGADQMCVDPPAETRFDPWINIQLYKAMGKPYSSDPDDPWPSVEIALDATMSARSPLKWADFKEDFQKNGWWDCKVKFPDGWGTYRRYETGAVRTDGKPGFQTPTGKLEIWSTVMETFYSEESDILPDYREAPLSRRVAPEVEEKYPFICNTGRRIPVYFHSEHRQLPWCRELWPVPRCEINPVDAEKLGVKQGDWVWIENENAKIRQVVDIYFGIEPGIVNCEHQWWYPELEQSGRGFELSGVNNLVTNNLQDRHCGSGYLRAYPVNIYKATSENSPNGNPVPCGVDGTEIIHTSDDPRLKDWLPNYEGRE